MGSTGKRMKDERLDWKLAAEGANDVLGDI